VQRWLLRRELEKFEGQPVFYLDECGVDHRLDREDGRAPRGERIYQAVAGKRRERTRIISAAQQGKALAQGIAPRPRRCSTPVMNLSASRNRISKSPKHT